MLVVLDSELSDPPSSRTCFRDVTLYVSTFLNTEVVVECAPNRIDFYWYWLREGGAMDFVSQLVRFGEVTGTSIRKDFGGSLNLERLNERNLSTVVTFINRLSIQCEKYKK